jgi:hypothetical protein
VNKLIIILLTKKQSQESGNELKANEIRNLLYGLYKHYLSIISTSTEGISVSFCCPGSKNPSPGLFRWEVSDHFQLCWAVHSSKSTSVEGRTG